MASFVGSIVEFNKYIGPKVRNIVQQITRPYKQDIGKCEHCGANGLQFDAAHKHGHERPMIIKKILSDFTNNEVITIDLEVFEKQFKSEHYPIADVILILCKKCHSEYDSKKQVPPSEPVDDEPEVNDSILDIKLEPSDVENFKAALISAGNAEITTYFNDGSNEVKLWNAANFTVNSNVFGNLRSRPNFRQGNWQQLNISHVFVRAGKIA